MRAKVSATGSTRFFVATGVLIFTAASAEANPEAARTPEPSHLNLPFVGNLVQNRGWLTTHFSRIQLHKKTGLAYTTRLERPGTDLELSFRGPGMGKKRFGLSIEVRF